MTGQRGGPGRGQGRKPVAEGEQTVTVSLRMTVAQRDKLATLGGALWVRQRIDKAKTHNIQFCGGRPSMTREQAEKMAAEQLGMTEDEVEFLM